MFGRQKNTVSYDRRILAGVIYSDGDGPLAGDFGMDADKGGGAGLINAGVYGIF